MRQLCVHYNLRAKLLLLDNDVIVVNNQLRRLIRSLNESSLNLVLNSNVKLHLNLINYTEVSTMLDIL